MFYFNPSKSISLVPSTVSRSRLPWYAYEYNTYGPLSDVPIGFASRSTKLNCLLIATRRRISTISSVPLQTLIIDYKIYEPDRCTVR